MTIRTVKSLVEQHQFDVFSDCPAQTKQKIFRGETRAFRFPDPNELYFGTGLLSMHLKEMNITEPFVIRELLSGLDWTIFETRYAVSGRAPYAPQAMMGLILYGIMQGANSLRGLERLARIDMGCMWVTGGVFPDHLSIGRFIQLHGESLQNAFFIDLTQSVLKATHSQTDCLAGDGTFVEAACSGYRLI